MNDKASRFNSGKPKLSLVLEFDNALRGASAGLQEGVGKYGRSNWRKGLVIEEIMDSLLRHAADYMSGKEIDPDSGLPSIDKLLCNALILSETYHLAKMGDERVLTANPNGGRMALQTLIEDVPCKPISQIPNGGCAGVTA